jgi:hypothetical protein
MSTIAKAKKQSAASPSTAADPIINAALVSIAKSLKTIAKALDYPGRQL